MEITIRSAAIQDVKAIASLTDQLGYKSSKEGLERRLEQLSEMTNNCVFVATLDNKVVGWIHAFYALKIESDPFVEIGGLVVDEHHRKLGIGKMLVGQVVQQAAAWDCSKIRVRCRTTRIESHVFYEKIGFSLKKEQKIFDLIS